MHATMGCYGSCVTHLPLLLIKMLRKNEPSKEINGNAIVETKKNEGSGECLSFSGDHLEKL